MGLLSEDDGYVYRGPGNGMAHIKPPPRPGVGAPAAAWPPPQVVAMGQRAKAATAARTAADDFEGDAIMADVADTQATMGREAATASGGDAAARKNILAGGLGSHFEEETVDPWHPSGGGLSTLDISGDLRAHGLLAARHKQKIDEIEARALRDDPMRKKIEAEALNQAYEELMPYDPRPLMAGTDAAGNPTPGQFSTNKAGVISNAAPVPRLGQMRQIQLGARATQQSQAIFQGLSAVQDELGMAVEQGQMTPQEATQHYKEAERKAAMMLQATMGGKDFSGFFKPKTQAEIDAEQAGPGPTTQQRR